MIYMNIYKGNSLSDESIMKVKQFFEYDDISSMMPGQKDFKKVKIGDQITTVQKRLIMGNLKDIFKKFKNENPNIKIGFSKFCSVRPEHCILAGAGGTHRVCVCPIHENMKLMMLGKL